MDDVRSEEEEEDGPRTLGMYYGHVETPDQLVDPTECDPPDLWYHQTDMSREAAYRLWWGLEAKTQQATYSIPAGSYSFHCAAHKLGPPFPASVKVLASWITELSEQGIRYKTIKAFLTVVMSVQDGIGDGDLEVFRSCMLQTTIVGIKRLQSE